MAKAVRREDPVRLELVRGGDGAVLRVGGRLTASQAGQFRTALLEAFDKSRRVEVALHDVQEVDLSILQLLCAAGRTAQTRAIHFTLSGLEAAEPVRRLIAAAGAEAGLGCRGGCLWSADGPTAEASGRASGEVKR